MIEFTIPKLHLVSLANTREHWTKRAKRAAEQRRTTRLHAAAAGLHLRFVALPAVVTITRIGPGRLDSDNAVISAKHVRDEIAAVMGIDDGDDRIEWRVLQERAKQWAVRVEIWARGEEAA